MVTSNKDAARIWKMIEDIRSSDNTPDRGPNDLEERIEDLMKINLSHQNLNADLRKEVRYQTDQAKFYKMKAEQLAKENKERGTGRTLLTSIETKVICGVCKTLTTISRFYKGKRQQGNAVSNARIHAR